MGGIFKRVEKKYIINKEQYMLLRKAISNQMIEDEYGKSTICNIYFDTEQYELIRHSITKPVYKDKIRLRSYNIPTLENYVFLEIKRKYKDIVSKRRIKIQLKDFYEYIENSNDVQEIQIRKELEYYFKYYKLEPKMFLSYNRIAYYDKDNRDFRLTFDSNIIAREYDLKIEKGDYGTNILEEDKYIMEVKTLGAMPMWFVNILNKLNICPCGFSKYGEAYTQLILKANKNSEYIA